MLNSITSQNSQAKTAAHIAHALAGERAQRLPDGGYLVTCPVPSHGRGRGDHSPSLQISDGQTRLLVYCHAGCDRLDVLDELRRRGLYGGDQGSRVRNLLVPTKSKPAKTNPKDCRRTQAEKAAWLWSQRKPIIGSIAERYLREARKYSGPLPPTLAFLPPSKPKRHPAMIAAFSIPDEPEPGALGKPHEVGAIHLTLLKPDGSGKADVEKPKLVVGSPRGRPIVLAPPNDSLALSICEGIEDALTAYQETGLGAWAAGSAGFMPSLANNVPDYIEAVTVFAHADKAGQDGAHKLAEALDRRGIEVRLEVLS